MKNLFPKTTEEWCTKKRQFMRLLQETDDPAMAQDYENAINFCDRGAIALRKIEVKRKRIEELKAKAQKRVKYVAVVISVVIVLWLLAGCLEGTMRGAGQMIKGTGQLVTGIGSDVVRATDGYSKEK